ncbi:beta-N-acetylhexosaminidase [Flavobacterium agrisoli]|uniref:Family 20 glycosylhydrolase n=1 Tax=Flavobacterium agrisoli TaxID=2793066 RepID=A0A934PJU9_9FLAO|nr:family 20 glycosylhydrolase [Flavobacterium agrisoli]MBK0368932.1 family 20 glycosylhydrolase [Flavobacterium agrisoli]
MKQFIALLFVGVLATAQVKKEQLNLMPWPQKITVNEGNFLLAKNFKVNITGQQNDRLCAAATRFLRRLDGRVGLFFEQGFITKTNEEPLAQLQINCKSVGKIGLYEDESYYLKIQNNSIVINATTDLGAMHALESLLQLLQNNGTDFYFPNTEISDLPRFTWRGLMIDVARHFQPVDVIKRNLDAMAAVKLNVFHWHLVDDQGWRIQMKKHHKLTDVASDGLFYTQEEIKAIVKYAEERGIMIIPEIDVPGHATAILTAYPEIGSKVIPITANNIEKNVNASGFQTYTVERNSGIFTPTLDPTNPKTYQLLSEIFDEVCPLFPGAYFHIGGDENEGKDWDANPKIQEFKKKNNIKTNHDLQTYFTMKLVPMLKKHGKQLMGWEEIMTKDMSKDAIIHAWRGPNEGVPAGKSLLDAAQKGYKTVLSNGFYVDLMQSVDYHYLNEPIPGNVSLTEDERARILGGEATMWTELATPTTLDSRLWPRTAAIAERLWSPREVTDLESMHKRLVEVSFRLEELGVTHIRNKEVLLRNISNNQDTSALNDFSNVCEPLKIYSRNKGGTEYQTYSPFTLFADVCVPDATDAVAFSKAVADYQKTKSEADKTILKGYLEKWVALHDRLQTTSQQAPLVKPLLPLAANLSNASNELLVYLDNPAKSNLKSLENRIEKCNTKEYADVELAVYESFKKLVR